MEDQLKKSFNEVAVFIIGANNDLAEAKYNEDYEQCALIQTAIDLRLFNESVKLSLINGMNQRDIFKALKKESDYIQNMLVKNFKEC